MRGRNRSEVRQMLACVGLVLGGLANSVASPSTIRIVVGGIEKQIYLPAALAERLSFFKEEGLDVELLSDSSGVNAEDELLSGGVQGVVGFYDHTIDLQAKGKFVQAVVQFSQAPGEAEIVSARQAEAIKSPAEFRGHTLGVTGLGSSTHFLTTFLAASNGVRANEFKVSAVGSGTRFVAAMREGRIDAGMTTEPTISKLLNSGDARLLVDLRTPSSTSKVLQGQYPGACLYMSASWIATHRDQVQRLANAFVKSLRYIDSHSAAEIAAQIPTDYLLGDRDLYVAALGDSKGMFTHDGRMPMSGPETVLKVLKTVNRSVQGKPIDLSRTYTNEFVSGSH
jgi:NitT/TauT family transport system substrate-binding protein